MSLGQWAACSQALIHILGHTNSWLGVSPLRHSPSVYVTFYPVMVGTFTLNLAVLVLSDCWAAFANTWHHWCIGHIPASLCCWFKCTAGSNISFPTLYHISWQCHTQRCRRQKRSFSFYLLHGRCTDHACLCPEDRKKLSQFQAPSYSLFYLSLGVILTLLIFLACCSSLRFLALWVVTAAPYVTHAVTSLPLLTHASLSFAAKKNKIHRAFICCLNWLVLC